jgi:high-affinity iron transporter
MFPAYVLSLREGLEAALVVGIVLGTLRQMKRQDLSASVWSGAGIAGLLSLAAAVLLTMLGLELKDPAEAIFEGLAMLLAGGLLTWMIFWMSRRAGSMRGNLESGVQRASLGGRWSLFGLAFLAVLREGVELALFLTAAALSSSAWQTLVGALFGLGTAALLGWSLFASTIRLNLKRFFTVTGILLVLFAAGLVSRGVHEFNDARWLPVIVAHIWDASRILSGQSTLGLLLATLFGYNPNPSLAEVLAYGLYFGAVLFGLVWVARRSGEMRRPAEKRPS